MRACDASAASDDVDDGPVCRHVHELRLGAQRGRRCAARERASAVGPLWAIPVTAAVFVVLAQSCARLAPWKRWLYAASVGLVAGAVVSAWWAVGVLSASKALDGRAASSLEFVVQGDPSINDDVYSYTCEARTDGKNLAMVRLSCDLELKVGAHVRVIGRVSRFENDAFGRSRALRGEVRKVKAVRIVSIDEGSPGPLLRLRNGLLASIAPATDPARALIAGVVCGRSAELRAQPAGDWFSVTGTAHLIAVSGSHLAIVGFVIEGVLQKTRCSRGLQRAILAITLVGYAAFTGASPSAVRACCMVFATLVVNGAGRRPARRIGTLRYHVHLCVAAADGSVRDGLSAFMCQRLSHSVLLPLCDLRFG